LRIALVSEHASPLAVLGGADAGGQNVHVAALATELAGQGHSVTVHTRRDATRLSGRVAMAGGVVVDHVDAGPPCPVPKDQLLPYMPAFAAELARTWRADPPDVAHAHFWMSGLASIEAARPLGIPVVQTFHALGVVKRRHQGGADTSPPERLAVEARLAGEVDHIVATCADEVEELKGIGADPARMTIIPCGVDLRLFRPAGPEAQRSGRPRILVVGRLVERKGTADVLRAMSLLPEAELVVAGGPAREELDDDPEFQRLTALAEQLGVSERVTFLGRIPQGRLPLLLRSAEVVACAPWYEPFGIVPLEAMACGTAVVASAVGGLQDSVVDGVTGLLVPPRHPERLAEAIGGLLVDDVRRRRMGRAGVARARSLYGWPSIARRTAEVYRQLARQLAEGRVSPPAGTPIDLAEASAAGVVR
jgi:D-inositol-3-phosphate glycosyltransferase